MGPGMQAQAGARASAMVWPMPPSRFGGVLSDNLRNVAFERVARNASRPISEQVLSPPPQSLAALPPQSQDRRRHAGGRTRHRLDRHDALFHAVQHRADVHRAGGGLHHLPASSSASRWWLRRSVMVGLYILFTQKVTEWRNQLRRDMVELDTGAVAHAVDSLLNFETVKYFWAEEREAARYGASQRRYMDASTKSNNSLALAQHRPGTHHQPDDGRRHGLYRLGLEQGPVHHRRRRAGQFAADAALPPARPARHGVSHDPPGPHRHGGNVQADRLRSRRSSTSPARGRSASSRARCASRMWCSATIPGARSSRASASPCRRATRSPSSARRAPASRPSRASCTASTISRAAAS